MPFLRKLVAVHFGHKVIEQYKIRNPSAGEESQKIRARCRSYDRIALCLKHELADFQRVRIVVDTSYTFVIHIKSKPRL
jgi:hypothetical protein